MNRTRMLGHMVFRRRMVFKRLAWVLLLGMAAACGSDTEQQGNGDGDEVLVFGTDPLDASDPTPVPEPSRWLLLAAGLGCLVALYRVRVHT